MLLGFSLFDRFPHESKLAASELHRIHTQISSRNREMLTVWYQNLPIKILQSFVLVTQQYITLTVLNASTEGLYTLRDAEAPRLRHAFGVLKVLFEANRRRSNYLSTSLDTRALLYDDIEKEKDQCLQPLDYTEFYNDAINMTNMLIHFDFIQWKRGEVLDFDLIGHSFLLEVATKAWYLLYHSILNQEISGRESVTRFFGLPLSFPYLVLRISRSDIVHDALTKLTATVAEGDLSKQLKVIFDEEEAVDEGGVTKEFFQLLIEELFNPNYGMFTYNEETRVFWFDRRSLESNLQFELIGVVLGLAIYNGVILDIHFPLVVYKKLLDIPVGLDDLADIEPDLASSLRKFLLITKEEVQAMDLTFRIDTVMFDCIETLPLNENYSQNEQVTFENRDIYVQSYIDWILNISINSQFKAFYRGFMKCCGEGIQKLALQPQELLLIICGSDNFDFLSLEKATQYRDGYTGNELTIKYFWEFVHELSNKDKKKLLFFVTGSDRIPVKGISSLQFFIGRAGGDIDRIPTAHTCFNYLLLPDYQNKEKLQKYLLLAIKNYKGFGLR